MIHFDALDLEVMFLLTLSVYRFGLWKKKIKANFKNNNKSRNNEDD